MGTNDISNTISALRTFMSYDHSLGWRFSSIVSVMVLVRDLLYHLGHMSLQKTFWTCHVKGQVHTLTRAFV
jgi:hypothetical protein